MIDNANIINDPNISFEIEDNNKKSHNYNLIIVLAITYVVMILGGIYDYYHIM